MTTTKRPNVRNNRYVVGERVYLKRRQRGRWVSGVVQKLVKDGVGSRAVLLSMTDGSARYELTSDVCRTPPPSRTPWIESERQGGGRRYWFRTYEGAGLFAAVKRLSGYHVADDGDTVWVSNGKKVTDEVRNQQAGKEVEHGN